MSKKATTKNTKPSQKGNVNINFKILIIKKLEKLN